MRASVLLALLTVAPVRAEDASVYRIDLAWDIPVSAVAAAGTFVPFALTDSLIHPHCPCPESEVPAFDRWAIGFASDTADSVSTITAVLAVAGPVALDLADVGASKPFLEDTVVFAETLLVNGAVTNLAKYTVQRPIPRVYSGLTNAPADYRSFYSGHTSTTFAALTAGSMTWTLRHGGERGPGARLRRPPLPVRRAGGSGRRHPGRPRRSLAALPGSPRARHRGDRACERRRAPRLGRAILSCQPGPAGLRPEATTAARWTGQ